MDDIIEQQPGQLIKRNEETTSEFNAQQEKQRQANLM